MTTDEEETGDNGSEEESLDLDALFDSIPTEAADTEQGVEISRSSDSATTSEPVEGGEARQGQAAEDSPEPHRRGRFDEFFDRIGASEQTTDADENTGERQSIQDLLGRVEGEASNSSAEEAMESASFMEEDSGDGGVESASTAETSESEESSSHGTLDLDRLSEAADLLFEASRGGGSEIDVCQPFFQMYPPSKQNVLLISLRQSAEDRRDAFLAGVESEPANLGVISSSDEDRQRQTGRQQDPEEASSGMVVKVVGDPGDLTRLGITISNVISSWEGNDNQTVVCFDSMSTLLQYADLQRVFRFVHVLQGRLGNVDAKTHYHLNPDAHDSQTEATIRSLFDGVVTVSEAGELTFE